MIDQNRQTNQIGTQIAETDLTGDVIRLRAGTTSRFGSWRRSRDLNCVSVPAGIFKGMCKQIHHFPEDTDYEADPSESFLREYLSLSTET